MAQALLNFAKTYAEVSDVLSLPESSSGDYVKLFFTQDGHIITHGTDYIPWGKGTIPISKLPISDSTIHDSDHLWDSKTIYEEINKSFVANDAMRFKGTMGLTADGKITINGEQATFPSSDALVGDTYRIVTYATYAGFVCEVGDLLMCIKAGTTTESALWTVAQNNINGEVEHLVNGSTFRFYSTEDKLFSIYAPSTGGNEGWILVSNGTYKAPTWRPSSDILPRKTLSAGLGLTMGGVSYDGTVDRTLNLIAATYDSIGGVTADSKTITLTNGKLSLTKNNVVNALGYDPDSVQLGWRPIAINNTTIGNNSLNIVNSDDITVVSNDSDDTTLVGFYINWYNISEGKYETV